MSEDKGRENRTQGKYRLPSSSNGPSQKKKEGTESLKYDGYKQRQDRNTESAGDNRKQVSKRNSQKFEEIQFQSQQPMHSEKKGGDNVSEKNIKVKYEEGSNVGFYSGLEEKPHIETIKNAGWHTLSETDEGESKIFYEPDFIELGKANEYFDTLYKKVKWFDKKVMINGVERQQPRLVAWYGPLPYTYSGVKLEPKDFPKLLLVIKESVENILKKVNINVSLNSVLLNLYRNGKDSVAWHSDDENTMGVQPTIASVSLGETRRFEMRRKPKVIRSEDPAELVVFLEHGSLVVMDGVMQTDWQHRVPKEYHSREPRINLTFRTVYAIEKVPRTFFSPSEKTIPFIPPPHPKMKAEPFQFQKEIFPTLGETTDHFHSKLQHPVGCQHRKATNGNSVNIDTKMFTKSVDTKTKSDRDYKDETEPVNLNCNSPVPQSSTTELDEGIWNENNAHDEFNQKKAADVTMDAHSNISETWKDKDISEVPEFIPKTQRISKSETMHPHSSEKKERRDCFHKEHQRRRTDSGNADNFEKNKTSNQKANHSKTRKNEEPNKEEMEIKRLFDVYDYICIHEHDIPFKKYHWNELSVLMSVVEHSQSLPTYVLKMLSDRLEFLINDAERKRNDNRQHYDNYGKGSQPYYRSSNSSRYDQRN